MQASLLVLTRHNGTARAILAMFCRRLPIWDGHKRQELELQVDDVRDNKGNAPAIASAVVALMNTVEKSFSPSAFGNLFVQEAQDKCAGPGEG